MRLNRSDWIGIISLVLGGIALLPLLGFPSLVPYLKYAPYFLFPAGAGLIWYFYSKLGRTKIQVEESNSTINTALKSVHLISHYLRDELHLVRQRVGQSKDKETNQVDEAKNEIAVLNEVCNQICALFEKLVFDRVQVCVRLVKVDKKTKRTTGSCILSGHCRNHPVAIHRNRREVVIREHTRFQHVHKFVLYPNQTLHYYSADVSKDPHYEDRNLAEEPYKSTIVLPIRCCHPPKNFLGFLKLQTVQADKLNDKWHVELLAMCADQIYSYLESSRAARNIDFPRHLTEDDLDADSPDSTTTLT